ncbi:hypothetical protein ACGF07_33625 [Kitasatospora sp. NPDC048194]|uniref:hypothetical protein n=1 Tax=Kitasatospora sp. NPDC048194 TaxID=3364045 RepID=UPI0037145476
MGIRSYLGFGSRNSSSSSSSGSTTGTSGDFAGGWHSYDEAEARRHHRMAQVPVAPAGTDQRGRRVFSSDPYNQPGAEQHTRRGFGRPYRQNGGAQ